MLRLIHKIEKYKHSVGHGCLTNKELSSQDYRRLTPRFQGENFLKNQDLIHNISKIASEKRCTPPQLALGWVLAQGGHIFAIPGTKRIKYLEENIAALNVTFTDEELSEIDKIIPKNVAAGFRYPEAMMRRVNR